MFVIRYSLFVIRYEDVFIEEQILFSMNLSLNFSLVKTQKWQRLAHVEHRATTGCLVNLFCAPCRPMLT
ncbi:hypothetical protein LMG29542_07947 [Paraburkholderia humisilvae]|uniref:Uncharacterized protein n=1 Tax=Paraburkholderia humisilvae TaxID=627669 RepID=A0A6J5F6Y9_9BURK|nr:hypothetical protein LMG29542_07947 [Paraburkholderia humisilvae]